MPEQESQDQNQNQNQTEIVQMNLAPIQRNAGRDYHEYFVPSSIKLVLATWSKADLDEQALDNSVMFRHRFGFEPSTVVRKQVLDIKNKYDLSDREVCWLRRSGHLSVTQKEAKIKPTRLMPWIGWMQLILYSFLFIGLGMQIALSTAPAWKQGLGEIAVGVLCFCMFWVMNTLYIAPWHTLKRSGAVS